MTKFEKVQIGLAIGVLTIGFIAGLNLYRAGAPERARQRRIAEIDAIHQSFNRGVNAAQGGPSDVEAACRELPQDRTIFCYEGFFYRQLLTELPKIDWRKKVDLESRVPKAPRNETILRNLWMTSLGLAAATLNQDLKLYKKNLSPRAFEYFIDGWAFERFLADGSRPATEDCETKVIDAMKPFCEFGMGRALFMTKLDLEIFRPTNRDLIAGYRFAQAFTSPNADFADFERISEMIKSVWNNEAIRVPHAEELAKCLADQHEVQCVQH